jgi:RHH-type transcriptional regulator, rel operon repressor / antitoxin RelB
MTSSDHEYFDLNVRQAIGIRHAIASLDRGESISHQEVTDWINSWGCGNELPVPKRPAS